MSNSTLSTLRAVEAELLEQKIELTAQLAELQARLSALRAVIPMFQDISADAETEAELAADAKPSLAQQSNPKADSEMAPLEPSLSTPEALEPSLDISKLKQAPKQAPNQAPNQAKVKKLKKAGQSKKDGRTAAWQRYLREGATEKSLPEAVLFFLQTQPEAPFTVADVMTALFKTADMPRAQYLKARNRISNILSVGTRDEDWYRIKMGTYSLSSTAKAA